MKTPTLEEVKEYFKDAIIIKDWAGDEGEIAFDKIQKGADYGEYFFQKNECKHLELWKKGTGFAEIIKKRETILGYKLFKTEFRNAVVSITGTDKIIKNEGLLKFAGDNQHIKNLEEAGVLELWFEKIYREDYKVGDIVVLTSNNDMDKERKFYSNNHRVPTNIPLKIIELNKSNIGGFNWLNFEGFECGGVSSNQARKATAQEIEEFNLTLPKIGCEFGEVTERHIKYGDKNLSKKTLLQMERVGITEITVESGDKSFKVNKENLKLIYIIAKQ